MKIVIAGLFDHYMYEEVCAEVLEKKGEVVIRVPFGKLAKTKLGKIEFYFTYRFIISFYYSLKLYKILKKEKPDILLCWRTTWLYDWVLIYAKRSCIKLVSYNNDDPFSPFYSEGNIHQRRLWRHFIRQIPIYDINLVYRPVNLDEYKNAGGKNVYLWLPYFIPWEIDNAPPIYDGKPIDVIFIGHWEKHREETIQFLLNNGINIKVYGTLWDKSNLVNKHEIKPLFNKDYFGYIKSSKIALAFLSKLNRDVYTRRNFEIPACKVQMLSEYTSHLHYIYTNEKSVKFFRNKEEALNQIIQMLNNPEIVEYHSSTINIHSVNTKISEFLQIVKK